MVKRQKNITSKNRIRKGFCKNRAKARKINASTPFETCSEQLSPFGGLLALIKFFDLVNFHKIFNYAYQPTTREPKLGHYSMMVGILMLLFIGFNRIWHFVTFAWMPCFADFLTSVGFLRPAPSGAMWTTLASIRPNRF